MHVLTKDLICEKTPDGRQKTAISRIFLIIFLFMFIGVLVFVIHKVNSAPILPVDDHIKLLNAQIDSMRLVLQALEWIIGFLLIYVFGAKGMEWWKTEPINYNHNPDPNDEDDPLIPH